MTMLDPGSTMEGVTSARSMPGGTNSAVRTRSSDTGGGGVAERDRGRRREEDAAASGGGERGLVEEKGMERRWGFERRARRSIALSFGVFGNGLVTSKLLWMNKRIRVNGLGTRLKFYILQGVYLQNQRKMTVNSEFSRG